MSASTDRAIANHHERRAERAEGKLTAVLAVHLCRRRSCAECGGSWPCLTVRIIEAVAS